MKKKKEKKRKIHKKKTRKEHRLIVKDMLWLRDDGSGCGYG